LPDPLLARTGRVRDIPAADQALAGDLMKINDLAEDVAAACGARRQVVVSVMAETFRQIQKAVDGGNKVNVPEFGVFMGRNTAEAGGESAKKGIRFRPLRDEAEKAARKEKKGKDSPAGQAAEEDDD
jgi:nucleoid DNA-binding protein